MFDPLDFIGRGSANRTALFGKTRMGKSNAIKIIAQTIFDTPAEVAQLIFDPSGEYTYFNDQDGTSLFILNRQRSTRYSLAPRSSVAEQTLGLALPLPLKINF
jgi:Helicase HerA, central domain